jgi:GNAT superfamily N-acetyltransferase
VTEVRLAQPAEFGRVGELTVAAYRLLPVDHLWGGYDDDILDTKTRAEHAEVLVALVDGQVVGSVTFVADAASRWSEWTEPGEVQFRLLAVDAAARGRGIGETLVRACITRARGAPIMIHTTPWMETARRMYDRLGFVRRPDRDVPYEEWHRPGIDNLPAEWIGQAFLAYSLSTHAQSAPSR